MSDQSQIRAGIDGVNAAINAKLMEVQALKKSVNAMCQQVGDEPQYPDADDAVGGVGGTIRPDQFYGKGLSTAVRELLERRKSAASTEEIVRGLDQGGFDFAALGWKKAEHRPRILAISLVKNTATFRRLPNGMFGVESWYEERVKRKAKADDAVKDEKPTTDAGEATAEPKKKTGKKKAASA